MVSQLRITEKADSEALFWDFGRETGAQLLLFDAAGHRISPFTFQRLGAEKNYPHISASPMQGKGDSCQAAASFQEAGYPFKFAHSDEEYILAAQYSPSRSDGITDAVFRSVPYIAVVVFLLSFLSAWIFSYYTIQPMIRINRIAGKMAELDFSWYCPDVREDEIGMLSRSINKLSDRLHEALDELSLRNAALKDEIRLEKEKERRRMLFFSGVSHELKTPVAVVIGQLEGMQAGIGVYKDREKYLAKSAEILQSLNQFIKEVLFLSHIDSDFGITYPAADGGASCAAGQAGQLNLSALVRQIIDDFTDYAEFYSVYFTENVEENLFVYGNDKLYQKAIGNIISNAVTHVGENGRVAVSLCSLEGRIELSVVNTPAHIEEEHLPHLFEAFYRAEESDGHGSGLGLYITGMIFETYQVAHSIHNTPDGVEFTASFTKTPDSPVSDVL